MAKTAQTFRTSKPTDQAVRLLTAEMAAALGGDRVTYDALIAEAVAVAGENPDRLKQRLAARLQATAAR